DSLALQPRLWRPDELDARWCLALRGDRPPSEGGGVAGRVGNSKGRHRAFHNWLDADLVHLQFSVLDVGVADALDSLDHAVTVDVGEGPIHDVVAARAAYDGAVRGDLNEVADRAGVVGVRSNDADAFIFQVARRDEDSEQRR